jgi:predicted permease
MLDDLRLALRTWGRQPVPAVGIVLPVALAIAVTTALFSVVDGLFFRALPIERPSEVVAIGFRMANGVPPDVAYLPYLLERRLAIVEGVRADLRASVQAGQAVFFDPVALEVIGAEVTGVDAGFFRFLGLRPVQGTDFTPEDERNATSWSQRSDVPLPVILGFRFWEGIAGSDAAALDVRELAGRVVRIVGVMGPGVKFPGETDIWAPVPSDRPLPPAYGRLKSEVTLAQLAGRYPDLDIKPLREAVRPGETRAVVLLFGSAALLLAVAWVQVAGLLFAGTLTRLPEMGTRVALGATPGRLWRQFAVEHAVLMSSALGLAWLLVAPLTTFIVRLLPAEVSRGQYLTPDARTFAFAGAAALVGMALLMGLPAGVLRRASPVDLLAGRSAAAGRRSNRIRQAMVGAQMTLTAALVYVAGVAAHSFVNAVTLEYGFDVENALVLAPRLVARPGMSNDEYHALEAAHNRLIGASVESLRDVPGVIAAERVFALPLRRQGHFTSEVVSFGGQPLHAPIAIRTTSVGPLFIQALGLHLVAGHGLDDPRYAGARDVAVVNEALARRLAPGVTVGGLEVRPPVLDRQIRTSGRDRNRIVGVVRDMVLFSPLEVPEPHIFSPLTTGGDLVVRGHLPVEAILPAVRVALDRVWGDGYPMQVRFLRDDLREVLRPFRGQALLFGLIALACLPIAAVGLTGAVVYFVRVRTREMAIQLALGADPAVVGRAVVGHALAPAVAGILGGTLLGIAAVRIVASQLVGVAPLDGWTVAGVAFGLLTLAVGAAWIPARHAAGIDPAAVLRNA